MVSLFTLAALSRATSARRRLVASELRFATSAGDRPGVDCGSLYPTTHVPGQFLYPPSSHHLLVYELTIIVLISPSPDRRAVPAISEPLSTIRVRSTSARARVSQWAWNYQGLIIPTSTSYIFRTDSFEYERDESGWGIGFESVSGCT